MASTCARPCGPRPNTSRRRASGAARWRTASADTAAVRRLVSAIPSTSAAGASVSASKTTHRPCTRGSPPTLTTFTTTRPPAADGITSTSPPGTPTALRGGSASGSSPSRSAASSASTASPTLNSRRTSAAERKGGAMPPGG